MMVGWSHSGLFAMALVEDESGGEALNGALWVPGHW